MNLDIDQKWVDKLAKYVVPFLVPVGTTPQGGTVSGETHNHARLKMWDLKKALFPIAFTGNRRAHINLFRHYDIRSHHGSI